MEQPTINPEEAAKFLAARRHLELDRQIKNGAGWFFWIAALSILNSVIYLLGNNTTFVVGLGVTQLIDGVAIGIAQQLTPEAGVIIRVVGYVLDLALAVGFILLGVFGRKRVRWVIITGMVIYGLDAILVLVFGDWFSGIFHLLALWGLWTALKGIKDITALESANPAGFPLTVQAYNPQMGYGAPATFSEDKPRANRRGLIFAALFFLVVFIAILAFMASR